MYSATDLSHNETDKSIYTLMLLLGLLDEAERDKPESAAILIEVPQQLNFRWSQFSVCDNVETRAKIFQDDK